MQQRPGAGSRCANVSGVRQACSIHHKVVTATVNKPSERTINTPLRRSCGHDNGFLLCSRGIGCEGGSAPPENACTPSAGGSAPPDEPSGCAPGAGETAAASPFSCPAAEGTDGCGAGWSSPPKGRPLKTTTATKRRTAVSTMAVRLMRSPQRFASPPVTGWCSAAPFCCVGRRGGAEGSTAPLGSRAALSTGRAWRTTSPPGLCVRTASCSAATFCCLGRRGGAEGCTRAVSGSAVAQCRHRRHRVAQSRQQRRSSRAALSTGRARRTTSPPGPCARTASCSAAMCCCLGRRGGAEGATGAVSGSVAQCRQHRHRVVQFRQHRDRVVQFRQHRDRVAQSRQQRHRVAQRCQPVVSGEPPHANAPAPLRAVQHRSAVSAAAAEPRA